MKSIFLMLNFFFIFFSKNFSQAQGLNYERGLIDTLQKPYTINTYFLLLPNELFPSQEDFSLTMRKTMLEVYEASRRCYIVKDYQGCMHTYARHANLSYFFYPGPSEKKDDSSLHSLSIHSMNDIESIKINQIDSLIGFTYENMSANSVEYTFTLLLFHNKQWENKTDELPKIKLTDFIDVQHLSYVSSELINNPPFYFTVVRKKIIVYLNWNNDELKKMNPSLYNKREYESIELSLKNGKFYISKKNKINKNK